MKDKKKGIIKIILSLLVIAGVMYIAIAGIGANKTGSLGNVKQGLDLAGGVSITYQTVKEDVTSTEIEDTRYKMQKRAEAFSTESEVYLEGNNRISVDIPDVTDADAVLEKLGSAGTIYFIYGKGPDGVQNIDRTMNADGDYDYFLTRSIEDIIADGDVVVDGADISGAEPRTMQDTLSSKYQIELTLNDSGKEKFGEATTYASQYYTSSTAVFEKLIAIVYDGEVVNAPAVQEPITGGTASITGQSSFDESKSLASIIRIGALPLELSVLRYSVVGAKLGAEAIDTSLIAGLIGFALIVVYMIILYRIQGVAADIALIFYVGMMVLFLNIFDVTLTLPGVAGILLSIGMAVDANVIIFTRIQEELATGKTVRSSIKSGFNKAMSAIIDGNVTTIIAAVVLYLIGSGTVKGFAQTLAIGIILSMITSLFVTKLILNALYQLGFDKIKFYGEKKAPKVRKYVQNFPKFIAISGAVLVIGIVALFINIGSTGDAFNYGLDFKGGTSTDVTFPDKLPENFQKDVEQLILDKVGVKAEISRVESEEKIVVKTQELSTEQRAAMTDALAEKYNVDPELVTTDSISATVSGEMKKDALLAVIIATVGMLLYIWIRFKNLNFASSAVIALIHDVLMVLVLYAVGRSFISMGNTFIACMLTIVGYSINATIVIFDRIRENMKEKLKKDSIADVVNMSISQTFSRSINTSLTTFIMIFMLAILGVSSVREFAIPLIAGIICGAFSSICLTGGMWYRLNKLKTKEE